jgi:hypothetical protein
VWRACKGGGEEGELSVILSSYDSGSSFSGQNSLTFTQFGSLHTHSVFCVEGSCHDLHSCQEKIEAQSRWCLALKKRGTIGTVMTEVFPGGVRQFQPYESWRPSE